MGSRTEAVTREYRWIGGVSAAFVLIAVGVVVRQPALLVIAGLPFAFVLYGALTTAPAVRELYVKRSVTPESPTPGESVTVEVTVENRGESAIPDLRVVDGVPERLSVTDGTPRTIAALPAGFETSYSYTMVAKRGHYDFEPALLTARNLSGSVVVTAERVAAGTAEIECTLAVEEFPLDEQTIHFSGPLATDSGGPGIEFYSTRDYRPGDERSRIDWRHFAKTNELTTVEYREHRAARVIVVIDGREPARQAEAVSLPTGAELSLYAAARAVSVLLGAGHEVGIAALGVADPDLGVAPAWIKPTGGRALRAQAQQLYDVVGETISGEVEGEPAEPQAVSADGRRDELTRLRERLPGDAQLLVVSPLFDAWPVNAIETLRAYHYPATVLSPTASVERTIGQQVEQVDRRVRLARLQALGVQVIDWPREQPLQLAVTAALQGRGPR